MCAGKDPVVLVEHPKVSFPGGRPLFLVRAGSGSRDSSSDPGDSSPLTDSSTPIVRDGLDTFRDVIGLRRGRRLGLGQVSMLNH